MAATEGITLARRAAAAVLFLQGGMYTVDLMSAVNSSPWTGENLGADAEKMGAMRFYVGHALAASAAYDMLASVIAESWAPMLGWGINAVYMSWLYHRAIRRGGNAQGLMPNLG